MKATRAVVSEINSVAVNIYWTDIKKGGCDVWKEMINNDAIKKVLEADKGKEGRLNCYRHVPYITEGPDFKCCITQRYNGTYTINLIISPISLPKEFSIFGPRESACRMEGSIVLNLTGKGESGYCDEEDE